MLILRDLLGNEIHVLWDLIPELRHITNLRWCVKSTHTQRLEGLEEKQSITSQPILGAVDNVLEAIYTTFSQQAE